MMHYNRKQREEEKESNLNSSNRRPGLIFNTKMGGGNGNGVVEKGVKGNKNSNNSSTSENLTVPMRPRRPSNPSLLSTSLELLRINGTAAGTATATPTSSTNLPLLQANSISGMTPTATVAPIKAILHDDPRRKAKGAKGITINNTTIKKSVGLFSHLLQYGEGKLHSIHGNVHPSIVKFSLSSAAYKNLGGSRRCKEMLLAFKDAIKDYRANPEMAICRHLDLYLKPMIGYMVEARPLGIAMANAVRALRYQISILPLEFAEHEAQEVMYQFIDSFITNRIELADKLIIQHGLSKIVNGDVILTFARSVVVRDLLQSAQQAGIDFRVIVVDSRPFKEGLCLLEELVSHNIQCDYVSINAIGYVMREVTKIIIGAAGIYANGTLLSRVGTAATCALGKRSNIPVIVCCETVKFSERSQIDSFVFNEIGDPDALAKQHEPFSKQSTNNTNTSKPLLTDWHDMENLKLLNILYDVTPTEYVTVIITEIGLIPVTSIPVVLREYTNQVVGTGLQ